MSGECGRQCSPAALGRAWVRGNGEELAKSASVTLDKLNAIMGQMSDWREERLVSESCVSPLRSALARSDKNPDETSRPDPLVIVRQRSEINRLELNGERLENEIRGLREALRESDQAITCSGAKRLKVKMTRLRAESAEERRRHNDEIRRLKLRVQDAENSSSCPSLSRLRMKLREILNGDKKIERVIVDVTSRSFGTLVDLSNELTRMKELLDELRLENIRLNRRRHTQTGELERAPNTGLASGCPDCSGRLETIERLRLHAAELERRAEGSADDSGLVERVGELESALNENQKKLEEREAVVVSLRNEILGAKTAYKMKSQELDGIRCYESDLEDLKNSLKERDELANDLRRQLTLSTSAAKDAERLGIEMKRIKRETLNLEIERDGLLGEIEKMGNIVSDRNKQIVEILEGSEEKEKARRSEVEGARTKLRIATADNKRLRLKCEKLEDELLKLNETNEACGDRSTPLVKQIRQIEKEIVGIQRISCPTTGRGSIDSNPELKNIESEAEARANGNLSDPCDSQRPYAGFTERWSVSEIENRKVEREPDELGKMHTAKPADGSLRRESNTDGREEKVEKVSNDTSALNDRDVRTTVDFQYRLFKLEADNAESLLALRTMTSERNKLELELRKLISAYRKLNEELEESKGRVHGFVMRNEELNEKVRGDKVSCENLEMVEEELRQASEEWNSLKTLRATIDGLRMENRELKASLTEEREARNKLRISIEKSQGESKERATTLGVKLTGDSGTKEKTKTKKEKETETETEAGTGAEVKTSVMNRGDYVRADRELKYYIHLQSLAVKRVVDFISYVVGRTRTKPAMATFVEPTRTDSMVLKLDENLTATFRMSQALSDEIFGAEVTVRQLEALKIERNNLKAERDCLASGIQKLSSMLGVGAVRCLPMCLSL